MSFRERGSWPDEVSGGQGVTGVEIRETYHIKTGIVLYMRIPDIMYAIDIP